MRLAPEQLIDLWRRASDVPPRFALGTAQHESDLDPGTLEANDGGTGRDSVGLYQVSAGEAVAVGRPGANLYDATECTQVYASLCAVRVLALKVAAGLVGTDVAELPPDFWAYLGMAHNLGTSAATSTIRRYGLDWPAYKARNSGHVWSLDDQAANPSHVAGRPTGAALFCDKGYGDDCISGGKYWRPEFDSLPAPVDADGNVVAPSSGLLSRLVLLAIAAGGLYLAFRPMLRPILKELI